MTMILGGTNPAVTFPDGTIQNSAFNGTALSASPYTTSLGANTLVNNSGTANTAVGNSALVSNTTASNNTAVGYQAGYSNTTGTNNVFFGWSAGYSNTQCAYNTFIGYAAGQNSNVASANGGNTCIGASAGNQLTTGTNNTFIGSQGTVLQGSGGVITTGSYNTILGNYNGNQGGLDIRTSSNYIVLSDGAGNPRAYWDSNGVGTTTGSSSSLPVFSVRNASGTTPNGLDIRFDGASPNNTTQFVQRFGDTISYKYYVYSNGNVVNSNNSYGAISDVKLKENIVDATPKLADLMNVKVRNYNLISDPRKTKQIGVVAQEIQTVFPSVVESTSDKDAEGKDLGTTTLSVKYSVLVPILVKAIQEQQALITDLTTRLAALEAK